MHLGSGQYQTQRVIKVMYYCSSCLPSQNARGSVPLYKSALGIAVDTKKELVLGFVDGATIEKNKGG